MNAATSAMSAAATTTVTARVDGPPLPREHGAWGILLIPFVIAAGIAGVFDLRLVLLLAGILCFYLARASYLKQRWGWTAALLAASALATVPLLVVWRLYWLAAFGAIAAVLAFCRAERTLGRQLLAVGGLTLTAPAAWYAATGQLDREALWLWLLNTLYFAGGILFVKMHIAAAVRRRPLATMGDRLQLGAATLGSHAGIAVLLGILAAGGAVPALTLLAFVPMVGRAVIGVAWLSPVLRIKRLAWTEVAYSVIYAILLVVAWRVR